MSNIFQLAKSEGFAVKSSDGNGEMRELIMLTLGSSFHLPRCFFQHKCVRLRLDIEPDETAIDGSCERNIYSDNLGVFRRESEVSSRGVETERIRFEEAKSSVTVSANGAAESAYASPITPIGSRESVEICAQCDV